jgi:hypothetical protein
MADIVRPTISVDAELIKTDPVRDAFYADN